MSVFYPFVSVDCVVFGFDGEKLKILLIERNINNSEKGLSDKKLPGSIIYEDENLDDAAIIATKWQIGRYSHFACP